MKCSSVMDRMWRVDVQVSSLLCLAMLSVGQTVLAPNDDRTTAKIHLRKQVEGA
jgi:hypothetical protein